MHPIGSNAHPNRRYEGVLQQVPMYIVELDVLPGYRWFLKIVPIFEDVGTIIWGACFLSSDKSFFGSYAVPGRKFDSNSKHS